MNHRPSYDELERKLKEYDSHPQSSEAAEQALRKSEVKCRTLIRSIPGMVYQGFPDHSLEVIAGSKKLCGYQEEELNGRRENWLSLLHPDDRERVLRENKAMEAAPGELVQEYRIVARDGGIRWVEDHKTSFLSVGGRFGGIDGIVFDISERKEAEQLVKEQHQLLNAMFESIPYPFYIIDARSYEILMANGITAPGDSWRGKTCYALTHRRDRPCNSDNDPCPLREVRRTGAPVVMEHVHFDAQGQKRNMEVHGYPIFNGEGRLSKMIELSLDITKRKEMEAERERLIAELQSSLSRVKLLSGFLPICSCCKKIRDDKGYWNQIEAYIRNHSEAEFSHSICPGCARKLYPDIEVYDKADGH